MLKLTSADIVKTRIATLVVPVCEDAAIHEDPTVAALADAALQLPEFKGKAGEEVTLFHLPQEAPRRVLFYGLGPLAKLTAESLRAAAGRAVKKGVSGRLTEMLVAAPSAERLPMDAGVMIEALLEGACLGNYLFDAYKREKKLKALKRVALRVTPSEVRRFKALPARVHAVCGGTLLARQWVNTPSNDKRPERFARAISTAAEKAGLKVTLLDEKRMRKLGFGALLAVGAGSQSPPRMVLLEYSPEKPQQTVVLVGKGVTFDSGGLNLKPSTGLADMKIDMAGAAAVAATLIAAAALRPAVRLVGAIPIVENMPSGSATRPGDIVRSYTGKTIEIGNTDAEGRLILVDAMAYAIEQYQPQLVIDLATLTGACMVGLGDKIAGVFSKDEDLAAAIAAAGVRTHERCWPLPLPADYLENLKSDTADISNMSNSKYGGAITAALFLSEFVGDARWAHIDIVGPVSATKASDYCPAGATGFGVRLLCALFDTLIAG